MYNLEELLTENPIIAAIRNNDGLEEAIKSNVKIVFVLYGNIIDVADICHKLKAADKTVFVHIDMIDGLKGDSKGIEFIKKEAGPFGIITTKTSNVRCAMNYGLCTIQRVFIIDSQSLQTGINNIHTVMPHAVEVLPGVASKIISIMQRDVKVPIIAGGLISSKKDVIESLKAGAIAVSTSSEVLWEMS